MQRSKQDKAITLKTHRCEQNEERCGFAKERTQKYVTEQNVNRDKVMRSLYAFFYSRPVFAAVGRLTPAYTP